ncbi:MAG: InlB B-repeat-containing protein [Clostridia bacterium]|nr:InlB B-repeat-containing protein [Clostridia bacterium]
MRLAVINVYKKTKTGEIETESIRESLSELIEEEIQGTGPWTVISKKSGIEYYITTDGKVYNFNGVLISPEYAQLIIGKVTSKEITARLSSNLQGKTIKWELSGDNAESISLNQTTGDKITVTLTQSAKTGKATLTAKTEDGSGEAGKCVIIVGSKEIDHIILNQSEITTTVNSTSSPITAKAIGTNGNEEEGLPITYISSNTSVATVNENGVVTGVGEGTTTITVFIGGKTATCKVTVTDPVDHIVLSTNELSVNAGSSSSAITAKVISASGLEKQGYTPIYTSSNTNIATVDRNGVVNGIAGGNATITVSINGITETCNVTVVYTIQYNANGGSGEMEPTISISPTIAENTFTRNGYTFNGWNTAANGSGISYSSGTEIRNNAMLFAQWSSISYTINYELNGGTLSSTNPTSYSPETDTFTLNNPSKEGWAFKGWSGTGLTGENNTTVTIEKGSTENRSYTAHFDKTITLTQKHGTSTTTQEYTLKDTETSHTFTLETSKDTLEGWTFSGWLNDATPKVQDYEPTATIEISENKTVYATYSQEFTATFIDYNGTAKQTRTVKGTAYGNNKCGGIDNQYATGTSPTQNTYTGWTSGGWTTGTASDATSNLSSNKKFTLNANTTYYGIYSQAVSLSYEPNGGSSTPSTQNGTRKTNSYAISTSLNPTFTLASAITKTGNIFEGWAVSEPISETKTEKTSITPDSGTSLTATAQWTAKVYTVTLNQDGGTGGTTTIYEKYGVGWYSDAECKNSITSITKPSKNGFTFGGYFKGTNTYTWIDSMGEIKALSSDIDEDNLQLTAKWISKSYLISYNLNGGTVSSANPTSYDSETETFTLNNPSKEGFTFKGWSGTGLTGDTNKSVTIPKGSTGNRSYTAQWTADTYTVTYNGNGATGGSTATQTATYDESFSVASNGFTKTGYSFAGWTTNTNGTDDGYNWTNWSGTWNFVNGQSGISGWKLQLYARWVDDIKPTIKSANPSTTLDIANYVDFNATDEGTGIAGYNITTSSTAPTTWIPVVNAVETATETKYEQNAAWARVFHHNNHWGIVLYDDESDAKSSNTVDKYSVLGNIAKYKNSSKWEFMLQYPDVSTTQYNRWTQTVNPTTSSTNVGYTAVHIDWAEKDWAGIAKSASTSSTFIDGSPGNSSLWWYAIGAYARHQGGIPGPNSSIVGTTNLWARIDNLTTTTSANLTRRLGDLKSNTKYYVWVKDNAGNTQSKAVTVNKVDTTAPTASITSTNNSATSQTATLTMNDNVGITKYYWGTSNPENANVTWENNTSKTLTKTVSSEGTYYLGVQDAAGNRTVTSKEFSKLTYDTNYFENDIYEVSKPYITRNFGNVTAVGTTTQVDNSSAKYGKELRWTCTTAGTGGAHMSPGRLTVGSTYTWSVYIKANKNVSLNLGHEQSGRITANVTTSWQRFTYTFTAQDTTYNSFTFYAKSPSAWEVGDVMYMHSLELKEVGGLNTSTTLQATENNLVLSTPTRTGYTFNGWYTAPTGGTKVTTSTAVPSSSTTYYAQWTIISYSISYTLNGGTNGSGNPSSYNIASDITLNNPTRSGYEFKGWSGTGLTGDTNKSVTIPKGSTGNRSYTANWLQIYNITYNANGGSGSMSKTTGTNPVVASNGFTAPSGKEFKGWNTKADGSGTSYAVGAKPGKSVTLYAQWELKSSYAVGDIVTIGGENFYVIEESNASTTTVKLLAALNVDTSTNKQSSSAGALAFDSTYPYTNIYADATIKGFVDSYKSALLSRWGSGKTIQEARLMTLEELNALGANVVATDYIGSTSSCPTFVNATNYWLGSPHPNGNNAGWWVRGDSSVAQSESVSYIYAGGLRPVIVVKKSLI